MSKKYAAADWGTSRLRVWLIDENGAPIGERRSDQGMQKVAREDYEGVLEHHLQELKAPDDLAVIVCGMAGARQGWQEADYLTVPTALNDIARRAVIVKNTQRDVRILPGLAQQDPSRPDVMRGEETQLLGALGNEEPSMLACLPGTHSKWALIESGEVRGFSSYMTGEMFALLTQQSILRHAVGDNPDFDPRGVDFSTAVREAFESPQDVLGKLFSLRASGLLFDSSPDSCCGRLSGLLIGAEISTALMQFGKDQAVRLIASGKMADLYQTAFSATGVEFTAVDADEAVLKGLVSAAGKIWV